MAQEQIEIQVVMDDGSIKKGFSNIEKAGSDVSNKLSVSYKQIAATITTLVGALGFKKSIEEAAQAESAITKFNLALRNNGTFSKAASDSFSEFSSRLQGQLGISDDVINSNAALLVSIGKLSGEGLQRATKAAIDFSAGSGRGLEESFDAIARAANGNTTALGKVLGKFDEGQSSSQKFEVALKRIEQSFGGVAEALASTTFQGALNKFNVAFNDTFESFGKLITQSPAIRASLDFFAKVFKDIAASTEALGKTNIVKNIVLSLAELVGFIVDIAGPVVERFTRFFIVGFNTILTTLSAVKTGFIGLSAFVNRLIGRDSIANELSADFEKSKQSTEQSFNDLAASTEKVWSIDITNSIRNGIANYKTAIEEAKIANTDLKNNMVSTKEAVVPEIQSIGQAFSAIATGFKNEANNLAKTSREVFESIGRDALRGLGNATGNAFAAFGKALVKGEDALKAFTEAFLSSIGQQAIASGTRFILEGIAYTFIPGFQGVGGAMIAAGAALATFGGALSALTSPGPTSTAGGGVAGGVGGTFGSDGTTDLVPAEPAKPQTNIEVNISGDVLDSDETGLRIVNLINNAFDKQGVAVTGAV